ncbi:MAG: translocation/assembly module TamB, partial [Gemmatimonadota bacterium]
TYLRGALHRVGAPPTPARIHLRSDGVRISGDLDLHSEGDGHLRLDGSARIPGVPAEADSSDTAPLDIRVASADLRLSALRPFVDARTVAELDGRLEADVTIGGSPSEPALDGTLQLQRGHIRLPALGTTWDDVVLTAHASGADLVVDSARAGSGSGSASLAGTISLVDPYPLDLSARLSSFQAIRTAPYHATVSGQLTASGSLGRPELEGDFSVESLDVYLGRRVADRNLETVELTAEDLSMLRDRFGYVPERAGRRARPLADRLTADLVVHLGRDSWLRNRSSPELSVPFTGDVEARLRPGEEPDLEGQVTTIAGRGFVEEFGRRFDLEEGTVTFDGPPRSARLDLSATYTIPARDDPNDAEATIVLTIRGTQESLDLELSSDPPMENSDIVSYIATGRPAAGALSFQGSQSDQGGLAEAGADLALGQLAGVIESAAGQGVGLDVVEIRREGLREATLVAGKYVSPRVYVGFAQPVTLREGDGLSLGNQGESEVEVEIEALRWLLVNLEGSSSAFRLFLKGRYAY